MTREFADNEILQAQHRHKNYDDRSRGPAYKVDDYVWLYNPAVPKGLSPKLAKR